MEYLISRITMKKDRYLFKDVVSGQNVFQYVDAFGHKYMANDNFHFFKFRVKLKK
jgi:hypothetical protein